MQHPDFTIIAARARNILTSGYAYFTVTVDVGRYSYTVAQTVLSRV